jgi:hypothetical protein
MLGNFASIDPGTKNESPRGLNALLPGPQKTDNNEALFPKVP